MIRHLKCFVQQICESWLVFCILIWNNFDVLCECVNMSSVQSKDETLTFFSIYKVSFALNFVIIKFFMSCRFPKIGHEKFNHLSETGMISLTRETFYFQINAWIRNITHKFNYPNLSAVLIWKSTFSVWWRVNKTISCVMTRLFLVAQSTQNIGTNTVDTQ
jgi:hypothetical protein